MARPDLGRCSCDGAPCAVYVGFLWRGRGRGGLLGAVVRGVGMPSASGLPELLGYPELQVGEGGDLRPFFFSNLWLQTELEEFA